MIKPRTEYYHVTEVYQINIVKSIGFAREAFANNYDWLRFPIALRAEYKPISVAVMPALSIFTCYSPNRLEYWNNGLLD